MNCQGCRLDPQNKSNKGCSATGPTQAAQFSTSAKHRSFAIFLPCLNLSFPCFPLLFNAAKDLVSLLQERCCATARLLNWSPRNLAEMAQLLLLSPLQNGLESPTNKCELSRDVFNGLIYLLEHNFTSMYFTSDAFSCWVLFR